MQWVHSLILHFMSLMHQLSLKLCKDERCQKQQCEATEMRKRDQNQTKTMSPRPPRKTPQPTQNNQKTPKQTEKKKREKNHITASSFV